MAEQYIYSRSDKGFVNGRGQNVALGFGFVAFSPNMGKALMDSVNVHSKDCPQLDESRLPLLRKTCLPKGQTLLQESTWIRDGERAFHVAHGYVLEAAEADSAGPEGWFAAPFRLENPNLVEDGILLDSLSGLPAGEPFRPRPLKETMESLGMNQKGFCQLLLACLDALSARTQLLIAWDFTAPDLRRSVLYWLYTCLPREIWPGVGFDSVYSEMSTPGQVQLVFVDRTQLATQEKYPGIQLGSLPVALGSRYLALDGHVIHNEGKAKSVWCGGEGIYVRWLEKLADALWSCTGEPAAIAQALDEFYANFQRQLDAAPKGERTDPKWYDVVCERSLDAAPAALKEVCAAAREGISEDEHIGCRLVLIDLLDAGERGEILEYFLTHRHRTPMGEEEAEVLRLLGGPGPELAEYVAAIFGAYMAEETDVLGSAPGQVLERYRRLLPEELYDMARQRLFAGPAQEKEKRIWSRCKVDGGEAACRRRRDAWYAQALPRVRVWEQPARIAQVLEQLGNGLSSRQLAQLWQEPFLTQCAQLSRSSLREMAGSDLPEKLNRLERELAALPGGVPGGVMAMLEEKTYGILLDEPGAFMTAGWLSRAASQCRSRGEVRETLALLGEYASQVQQGQGDMRAWVACRRRHPQCRAQVFGILPALYLEGALIGANDALVLSFLHQLPESRREIVCQAAACGGGRLVMEMLRRSLKYECLLGSGGMTDLLAVVECVSGDGQVLEQLGDGFRQDFEAFLRSQRVSETLSQEEITRALGGLRRNRRGSGQRQRR